MLILLSGCAEAQHKTDSKPAGTTTENIYETLMEKRLLYVQAGAQIYQVKKLISSEKWLIFESTNGEKIEVFPNYKLDDRNVVYEVFGDIQINGKSYPFSGFPMQEYPVAAFYWQSPAEGVSLQFSNKKL